MKRRVILATIVMATLLAGVLGAATLAGVEGVSAGSSTLEYKFLMPRPLIDEITDPLNTCTRSDNPTGDAGPFLNCPAGATASNGNASLR